MARLTKRDMEGLEAMVRMQPKREQHDAHVQAFKATLNDEQYVRRDGYVTNYSEEPHHG